MTFTRALLQSIDLSMWFCLPLWVGPPRSDPAPGKQPLRKNLQEQLCAQAGKCSSQEARQASLLQGKRGLTAPGRSGCKSVWDLTCALLGLSSAVACCSELGPRPTWRRVRVRISTWVSLIVGRRFYHLSHQGSPRNRHIYAKIVLEGESYLPSLQNLVVLLLLF